MVHKYILFLFIFSLFITTSFIVSDNFAQGAEQDTQSIDCKENVWCHILAVLKKSVTDSNPYTIVASLTGSDTSEASVLPDADLPEAEGVDTSLLSYKDKCTRYMIGDIEFKDNVQFENKSLTKGTKKQVYGYQLQAPKSGPNPLFIGQDVPLSIGVPLAVCRAEATSQEPNKYAYFSYLNEEDNKINFLTLQTDQELLSLIKEPDSKCKEWAEKNYLNYTDVKELIKENKDNYSSCQSDADYVCYNGACSGYPLTFQGLKMALEDTYGSNMRDEAIKVLGLDSEDKILAIEPQEDGSIKIKVQYTGPKCISLVDNANQGNTILKISQQENQTFSFTIKSDSVIIEEGTLFGSDSQEIDLSKNTQGGGPIKLMRGSTGFSILGTILGVKDSDPERNKICQEDSSVPNVPTQCTAYRLTDEDNTFTGFTKAIRVRDRLSSFENMNFSVSNNSLTELIYDSKKYDPGTLFVCNNNRNIHYVSTDGAKYTFKVYTGSLTPKDVCPQEIISNSNGCKSYKGVPTKKGNYCEVVNKNGQQFKCGEDNAMYCVAGECAGYPDTIDGLKKYLLDSFGGDVGKTKENIDFFVDYILQITQDSQVEQVMRGESAQVRYSSPICISKLSNELDIGLQLDAKELQFEPVVDESFIKGSFKVWMEGYKTIEGFTLNNESGEIFLEKSDLKIKSELIPNQSGICDPSGSNTTQESQTTIQCRQYHLSEPEGKINLFSSTYLSDGERAQILPGFKFIGQQNKFYYNNFTYDYTSLLECPLSKNEYNYFYYDNINQGVMTIKYLENSNKLEPTDLCKPIDNICKKFDKDISNFCRLVNKTSEDNGYKCNPNMHCVSGECIGYDNTIKGLKTLMMSSGYTEINTNAFVDKILTASKSNLIVDKVEDGDYENILGKFEFTIKETFCVPINSDLSFYNALDEGKYIGTIYQNKIDIIKVQSTTDADQTTFSFDNSNPNLISISLLDMKYNPFKSGNPQKEQVLTLGSCQNNASISENEFVDMSNCKIYKLSESENVNSNFIKRKVGTENSSTIGSQVELDGFKIRYGNNGQLNINGTQFVGGKRLKVGTLVECSHNNNFYYIHYIENRGMGGLAGQIDGGGEQTFLYYKSQNELTRETLCAPLGPCSNPSADPQFFCRTENMDDGVKGKCESGLVCKSGACAEYEDSIAGFNKALEDVALYDMSQRAIIQKILSLGEVSNIDVSMTESGAEGKISLSKKICINLNLYQGRKVMIEGIAGEVSPEFNITQEGIIFYKGAYEEISCSANNQRTTFGRQESIKLMKESNGLLKINSYYNPITLDNISEGSCSCSN